MEIVVIFLLIILAFIEGSVTTLPLVLVCLITLAAHTKSSRVYAYGLLGGCLLDILTGRPLGLTGLIFSIFLFMIFLYQRKYEIDSYIFVCFASIMLSLIFSVIFASSGLFSHVIISALFGEMLFLLWKILFMRNTTQTTSAYTLKS